MHHNCHKLMYEYQFVIMYVILKLKIKSSKHFSFIAVLLSLIHKKQPYKMYILNHNDN